MGGGAARSVGVDDVCNMLPRRNADFNVYAADIRRYVGDELVPVA